MRPFWSVALGWVLLLLVARAGGYDLYADPLGWLLVLLGVRALPATFPRRGLLLGLAALAGAVSVVLFWPVMVERVADADPSLGWAADLPRFGWLALFGLAAGEAARSAGEAARAAWWRTLAVAGVVVMVLPVLVFGAGLSALDETAATLALLAPLVLVVLLLLHSGRPWAGAPTPEVTDPDGSGEAAR